MDLLPGWRALAPLARVMHWANTEGGYVRDSWRDVPPEEYRAALARHFFKWLDDPSARDEKSGFSHLAHLGCCVLFLLWHGDGDVPDRSAMTAEQICAEAERLNPGWTARVDSGGTFVLTPENAGRVL